MEIREVEPSDLEEVNKIASNAFDDFNKFDYERMASNKNYKFFVAKRESEVLGYVIFLHIDEKLEIIKIAVKPKARRCGVASKMIKAMLEFAKENNHTGIILEVNENNCGARSFYEKMGFVSIYVRKKYYGGKDDAVIMELKAI